MATNKRQHVVPRAYISQFCDPQSSQTLLREFVWVYERGRGLPFPKSPKKLTIKNYYYSWFGPNGERSDAADEVLRQFEDRGIPVLKKLANGDAPDSLSAEERYNFAHFGAFLSLRVPQFRGSVEKFRVDIARITGQVAAAHPGCLERWAEAQYPKEGKAVPSKAVIEKARAMLLSKDTKIRVDPLVSLQAMLQMAPTVAAYVYIAQWRVLTAPDGSHFVAGDLPLVQITTTKMLPFDGVGWATPHMEATLPLSPRRCLLISFHHPAGRETTTADRVHEINLRSTAYCKELVYSSQLIDPRTLNRPTDWTGWVPASDVVDLSWLERSVDVDGMDGSPTPGPQV